MAVRVPVVVARIEPAVIVAVDYVDLAVTIGILAQVETSVAVEILAGIENAVDVGVFVGVEIEIMVFILGLLGWLD